MLGAPSVFKFVFQEFSPLTYISSNRYEGGFFRFVRFHTFFKRIPFTHILDTKPVCLESNFFRVGPGLDLDYKADRAKGEEVEKKLMEL